MADHLKNLPVAEVAGWYRRLVALVAQRRVDGREPYAAMLLRTYLDNRDPKATYRMPARAYLQNFSKVLEVLRYHRRVFLSQEEARVGMQTRLGISRPVTRLAGVVPRLKGDGHPKWSVPGRLDMEYSSLVQIGDDPLDILRIQQRGGAAERDLFTSLRGFQLHSKIAVQGTPQAGQVRIAFASWNARVEDRYDWNYAEHLTMPNPDFGSKKPGAVRPGDQTLTVHHSNAKRLEDAGLAAPYDVHSDWWQVTDPPIIAPASVKL